MRNYKLVPQGLIALGALFLFGLGYTNCSGSGYSLTQGSGSGGSSSQAAPSTNPSSSSKGDGFVCKPTATSSPAKAAIPSGGSAYTGQNVLPVTLGMLGQTPNTPSVSVTICADAAKTNCVTINNILLDTGSTGLRVLASAMGSALENSLPHVQVAGADLAECYGYADSTYYWGPMKMAYVTLGSESTSVAVPIQVADYSFGDSKVFTSGSGTGACYQSLASTDSANGMSAPTQLGDASVSGNGILGVNFLVQDCGADCVSRSDLGLYFTCTGSTCNPSAAALSQQASNPIGAMPYDNNGIYLNFPAPTNGAGTDVTGNYAFLGIGTQANNTPGSSVVSMYADPSLSDKCGSLMTSDWEGQSVCSFLDSGTSILSFPNFTNNPLPTDSQGYYTPSLLTTVTVRNYSSTCVTNQTNMSVENIDTISQSYDILQYIGIEAGQNDGEAGDVTYGFPFFLGQSIYVGLEGTSSPLCPQSDANCNGWYWGYTPVSN